MHTLRLVFFYCSLGASLVHSDIVQPTHEHTSENKNVKYVHEKQEDTIHEIDIEITVGQLKDLESKLDNNFKGTANESLGVRNDYPTNNAQRKDVDIDDYVSETTPKKKGCKGTCEESISKQNDLHMDTFRAPRDVYEHVNSIHSGPQAAKMLVDQTSRRPFFVANQGLQRSLSLVDGGQRARRSAARRPVPVLYARPYPYSQSLNEDNNERQDEEETYKITSDAPSRTTSTPMPVTTLKTEPTSSTSTTKASTTTSTSITTSTPVPVTALKTEPTTSTSTTKASTTTSTSTTTTTPTTSHTVINIVKSSLRTQTTGSATTTSTLRTTTASSTASTETSPSEAIANTSKVASTTSSTMDVRTRSSLPEETRPSTIKLQYGDLIKQEDTDEIIEDLENQQELISTPDASSTSARQSPITSTEIRVTSKPVAKQTTARTTASESTTSAPIPTSTTRRSSTKPSIAATSTSNPLAKQTTRTSTTGVTAEQTMPALSPTESPSNASTTLSSVEETNITSKNLSSDIPSVSKASSSTVAPTSTKQSSTSASTISTTTATSEYRTDSPANVSTTLSSDELTNITSKTSSSDTSSASTVTPSTVAATTTKHPSTTASTISTTAATSESTTSASILTSTTARSSTKSSTRAPLAKQTTKTTTTGLFTNQTGPALSPSDSPSNASTTLSSFEPIDVTSISYGASNSGDTIKVGTTGATEFVELDLQVTILHDETTNFETTMNSESTEIKIKQTTPMIVQTTSMIMETHKDSLELDLGETTPASEETTKAATTMYKETTEIDQRETTSLPKETTQVATTMYKETTEIDEQKSTSLPEETAQVATTMFTETTEMDQRETTSIPEETTQVATAMYKETTEMGLRETSSLPEETTQVATTMFTETAEIDQRETTSLPEETTKVATTMFTETTEMDLKEPTSIPEESTQIATTMYKETTEVDQRETTSLPEETTKVATTMFTETTEMDLNETTSIPEETTQVATTMYKETTDVDQRDTTSLPEDTEQVATTMYKETTKIDQRKSTSLHEETTQVATSMFTEKTEMDQRETTSVPEETTQAATTMYKETTEMGLRETSSPPEETTQVATSMFTETTEMDQRQTTSLPEETTQVATNMFTETTEMDLKEPTSIPEETTQVETTMYKETTEVDQRQSTSLHEETTQAATTKFTETTEMDLKETTSIPEETTQLAATMYKETTEINERKSTSVPEGTTQVVTTMFTETTEIDQRETSSIPVETTQVATTMFTETTKMGIRETSSLPDETTQVATTMFTETTEMDQRETTSLPEETTQVATTTFTVTTEMYLKETTSITEETKQVATTLYKETTEMDQRETTSLPEDTTQVAMTIYKEITEIDQRKSSSLPEETTQVATTMFTEKTEMDQRKTTSLPAETTQVATTMYKETTDMDLKETSSTPEETTQVATTMFTETTEVDQQQTTSIPEETIQVATTMFTETTEMDLKEPTPIPEETTQVATTMYKETTEVDQRQTTSLHEETTQVATTMLTETTEMDLKETTSIAEETTQVATTMYKETTEMDQRETTSLPEETTQVASTMYKVTTEIYDRMSTSVPEGTTQVVTTMFTETTEMDQRETTSIPVETTQVATTMYKETAEMDLRETSSLPEETTQVATTLFTKTTEMDLKEPTSIPEETTQVATTMYKETTEMDQRETTSLPEETTQVATTMFTETTEMDLKEPTSIPEETTQVATTMYKETTEMDQRGIKSLPDETTPVTTTIYKETTEMDLRETTSLPKETTKVVTTVPFKIDLNETVSPPEETTYVVTTVYSKHLSTESNIYATSSGEIEPDAYYQTTYKTIAPLMTYLPRTKSNLPAKLPIEPHLTGRYYSIPLSVKLRGNLCNCHDDLVIAWDTQVKLLDIFKKAKLIGFETVYVKPLRPANQTGWLMADYTLFFSIPLVLRLKSVQQIRHFIETVYYEDLWNGGSIDHAHLKRVARNDLQQIIAELQWRVDHPCEEPFICPKNYACNGTDFENLQCFPICYREGEKEILECCYNDGNFNSVCCADENETLAIVEPRNNQGDYQIRERELIPIQMLDIINNTNDTFGTGETKADIADVTTELPIVEIDVLERVTSAGLGDIGRVVNESASLNTDDLYEFLSGLITEDGVEPTTHESVLTTTHGPQVQNTTVSLAYITSDDKYYILELSVKFGGRICDCWRDLALTVDAERQLYDRFSESKDLGFENLYVKKIRPYTTEDGSSANSTDPQLVAEFAVFYDMNVVKTQDTKDQIAAFIQKLYNETLCNAVLVGGNVDPGYNMLVLKDLIEGGAFWENPTAEEHASTPEDTQTTADIELTTLLMAEGPIAPNLDGLLSLKLSLSFGGLLCNCEQDIRLQYDTQNKLHEIFMRSASLGFEQLNVKSLSQSGDPQSAPRYTEIIDREVQTEDEILHSGRHARARRNIHLFFLEGEVIKPSIQKIFSLDGTKQKNGRSKRNTDEDAATNVEKNREERARIQVDYTVGYDLRTVLLGGTLEEIEAFIRTVYLDDLARTNIDGRHVDDEYSQRVLNEQLRQQVEEYLERLRNPCNAPDICPPGYECRGETIEEILCYPSSIYKPSTPTPFVRDESPKEHTQMTSAEDIAADTEGLELDDMINQDTAKSTSRTQTANIDKSTEYASDILNPWQDLQEDDLDEYELEATDTHIKTTIQHLNNTFHVTITPLNRNSIEEIKEHKEGEHIDVEQDITETIGDNEDVETHAIELKSEPRPTTITWTVISHLQGTARSLPFTDTKNRQNGTYRIEAVLSKETPIPEQGALIPEIDGNYAQLMSVRFTGELCHCEDDYAKQLEVQKRLHEIFSQSKDLGFTDVTVTSLRPDVRSHRLDLDPYLLANYTALYSLRTILHNHTADAISEFVRRVYLNELYEGFIEGGQIDSSFIDYVGDQQVTEQVTHLLNNSRNPCGFPKICPINYACAQTQRTDLRSAREIDGVVCLPICYVASRSYDKNRVTSQCCYTGSGPDDKYCTKEHERCKILSPGNRIGQFTCECDAGFLRLMSFCVRSRTVVLCSLLFATVVLLALLLAICICACRKKRRVDPDGTWRAEPKLRRSFLHPLRRSPALSGGSSFSGPMGSPRHKMMYHGTGSILPSFSGKSGYNLDNLAYIDDTHDRETDWPLGYDEIN